MRHILLTFVSLAAFGVPAVAVHAQAAPITTRPISGPYAGLIAQAARRFSIPAAWIRAIMHVESRGDRRALSPKGAMGLMQLMPETWAALRARYELGHDPFEPRDNILAGAAFLREMYDRYGSPGFLAAYNAGPGRYEDYRDRGRPLPPETIAYVADLLPLPGNGTADGPVTTVASEALAWTQAPLFIMQPAAAEHADHGASNPPSHETPTFLAVRDMSGIAPQSAGLFVRISATATKP